MTDADRLLVDVHLDGPGVLDNLKLTGRLDAMALTAFPPGKRRVTLIKRGVAGR
ncbi:hypothetical protein [Pseudonocardia alaniniphila]|uniref:Uncharacterized protein n=1 Tax=Pseudonocardia alaniniphila TaxID=75291 RepID=A0ABS9TGA4_9PSEU|nr:hypothetical protein [Pseudonocardia alaniniphila]MCH6167523.1 hypothetical protein [Pseudonocardia alaniniphila]